MSEAGQDSVDEDSDVAGRGSLRTGGDMATCTGFGGRGEGECRLGYPSHVRPWRRRGSWVVCAGRPRGETWT